jgi:DNA adenine methylase
LAELQQQYHQLDWSSQKSYFYEVRAEFNKYGITNPRFFQLSEASIRHVAFFFLLNRTCFNGLYRVNRDGGFNVPFGGYTNPKIFDAENIRAASLALQLAHIVHGDFSNCLSFVDAQTFVYCDPPYRPLTKTSSFNSYASEGFDDDDQARLTAFARQLTQKGAKLMLSNSDPHNQDGEDNFFVDLYAGFYLHKVWAKRMINSNGHGRGQITELLITNYA